MLQIVIITIKDKMHTTEKTFTNYIFYIILGNKYCLEKNFMIQQKMMFLSRVIYARGLSILTFLFYVWIISPN